MITFGHENLTVSGMARVSGGSCLAVMCCGAAKKFWCNGKLKC